jgi:hypothetical protein
MRSLKRAGAAALVFIATAGVASTALAQQAQTEGRVGMALPGTQAVAGDSDHERVVGSLAVGYLGRRGMLVGTGPDEALQTEVNAPIVGVRYWISDLLGIDAGLGFGFVSDSGSVGGTDTDEPSSLAFLIHGGVPLSLASTGHFSFQIVPELNIGFANWSQEQGGGNDFSGSGFHLDVGARAGAEIHFGFIGVPQLSLQGSVGLLLALDSTSWEDEAVAGSDLEASRLSFGTTVGDNPWNIFTSNVAALYYF